MQESFLPYLWPPARRGLRPGGKTYHGCLVQPSTQPSLGCALPSLDYGYPLAITYCHLTGYHGNAHGYALIVIHTFGADMKFHPHIHLIVTGGGLSLNGKRWIKTDPRFLMHHGGLKKRWKYQITTRMKKAHSQGPWRFPKSNDFLKQYPCFAAMINKPWNLTWYAYIGASLLDPRFSTQYIGRYTKRAVMAEYRIIYHDGKIVRFSYRDYAEGGKTRYMTFCSHVWRIPRRRILCFEKFFGIQKGQPFVWECPVCVRARTGRHDCHEGVVIS